MQSLLRLAFQKIKAQDGRMIRWLFAVLGIVVALSLQPTGYPQSAPSTRAANPLVREQQEVVVHGVTEIWRLQWKTPPRSTCGPDDLVSALTCPCSGFAYGESGQLDLIRVVNGREIDRLNLTPLFEHVFADQNGAILQRWPTQDADYENSKTEGFLKRVENRPIVRIMTLGDYNHDGQATEFYLQTGVEPCGKNSGIVIGLTRKQPKLHAFTSSVNPKKPLYLQKREWDSLLHSSGHVDLLDWPCGDHASPFEDTLRLSVESGGEIEAIRRRFDCTEDGKRGRLLQEMPF